MAMPFISLFLLKGTCCQRYFWLFTHLLLWLKAIAKVSLTSGMRPEQSGFVLSMLSLHPPHPIFLSTCFLSVQLNPVGSATCQKWGTGGARGKNGTAPSSALPNLQQRCLHSLLQLKSYSEKLDKEEAALKKIESKADPR